MTWYFHLHYKIKWIILNDAIVSKSSDFLEIKTLKKEEKKVMVHLMTYYM